MLEIILCASLVTVKEKLSKKEEHQTVQIFRKIVSNRLKNFL